MRVINHFYISLLKKIVNYPFNRLRHKCALCAKEKKTLPLESKQTCSLINKQCMVLNGWKRAVLSSHPRGLGTVFLHTGVRRVTQHLFKHGLFGSFLLGVFLHKLRQLSMDGLPKKGQREWKVCVCVCVCVVSSGWWNCCSLQHTDTFVRHEND